MAFKFLWSRNRKWPVRIIYDEKVIFVEILNRLNRDPLIQVLDSMCRQFDTVILSQFVNPEIWTPRATSSLVNLVQEENASEIKYLHLLGEAEINAKFPLMQINIAGKLTRDMWQRILHMGMNNLSNIIFGLRESVDDWAVEISRRNQIVIDWFNLKIRSNDRQFINLVDESEFIGMAIDGDLFFCFSRIKNLNNLLDIIDGISEKNNYVLELSIRHISEKS